MTKSFSLRMVRNAAVMVAAVAAVCFLTQDANAQGCGYGGYGNFGGGFNRGISLNVGGGGFGVGYGGIGYGGYGRGINVGFNSYRPVYRPPVWHDTSHFDYYPGRFVPHGNHLDYIPGHRALHRTGHWHR